MTTSITKTLITALLTKSVALAWGLVSVGEHVGRATARSPGRPRDAAWEGLYEGCAGVLLRLHALFVRMGEALEAATEGTAARLGIDIDDVLAPLTDRARARHEAA